MRKWKYSLNNKEDGYKKILGGEVRDWNKEWIDEINKENLERFRWYNEKKGKGEGKI